MDHLQRSLLNHFTLQPLDRKAHRRRDDEWLMSQLASKLASLYITRRGRIVTHLDVPIRVDNNHPAVSTLPGYRIFLGCDRRKAPVFVLELDDLRPLANDFDPKAASLRDLAGSMDPETASLLAYALQLTRWHRTTRFCRRCGGPLRPRQGGHVQECGNAQCGHIEFPRINPAVIMRVCCEDNILLARQQSWPANRYSVLAGFVEPGETLEQAVQREVFEEAGVRVSHAEYHSSQPWPFPNSLMLGYCAWADSMDLDIEQDDLERAVWVNAEDLTRQMDEGSIVLSPPISISHRLIEDWFMEQTGRSIKEWQKTEPEHIR